MSVTIGLHARWNSGSFTSGWQMVAAGKRPWVMGRGPKAKGHVRMMRQFGLRKNDVICNLVYVHAEDVKYYVVFILLLSGLLKCMMWYTYCLYRCVYVCMCVCIIAIINAWTTNMYKRMLANNGKGTEKFYVRREIINHRICGQHYFILLGTSKLLSHDEFTT